MLIFARKENTSRTHTHLCQHADSEEEAQRRDAWQCPSQSMGAEGPVQRKFTKPYVKLPTHHRLLCQGKQAGVPSPLDKLFQNVNETSPQSILHSSASHFQDPHQLSFFHVENNFLQSTSLVIMEILIKVTPISMNTLKIKQMTSVISRLRNWSPCVLLEGMGEGVAKMECDMVPLTRVKGEIGNPTYRYTSKMSKQGLEQIFAQLTQKSEVTQQPAAGEFIS